MHTVVDVALPVFAIVLAGFLAGCLGRFDRAGMEGLRQFVQGVALPAVVILATARRPPADFFYMPFIGAFLGAAVIVSVMAILFGGLRRGGGLAVHGLRGLGAAGAETAFLGIPLFAAAFGADQIGPAVLATVLLNATLGAIAVVVLEIATPAGRGWRRRVAHLVGRLFGNPLLLAAAAGLLWAEFGGGLALPGPAQSIFELLGAAAGPCALFTVGLFLAWSRQREADDAVAWGDLVGIVALKMFWQPVLTWLLADLYFGMDPFWTAAAVMLAALPTGLQTATIARRYQVYQATTAAVVLISTLLSVATVSALLALFVPNL